MNDNFDIGRFNRKLASMPEIANKGDKTLIQKLLEKRLALGLSRAKICRLLDSTEMTLIRWEKGTHKPSPVYEKKILQLLGTIEKLETSKKKGKI